VTPLIKISKLSKFSQKKIVGFLDIVKKINIKVLTVSYGFLV